MSIPQWAQQFANEPIWAAYSGPHDKAPRQPNGDYAKVNDPSTWSTLDECLAAVATGRFAGVGIMMLGLKGFIAIDLDNMRDPGTGEPINEAAARAISCGSYVEVSQSGRGYHIFGTGNTDDFQHKENGVGFEVYGGSEGRFLIVTGNRLPGAPDKLKDVTESGRWLRRTKEARQASTSGPAIKQGDRSATFFATVRDLYRLGLSPDAIEAACRVDPVDTGAIKYLENGDRLRQEIDRALAKPDPHAAMVEHGRTLWQGCTHVGGVAKALALSTSVSRPGFVLRLAGEYEATEPESLIEGFVELGCLLDLFGAPAVGKSFLAIDWTFCVGTGTPFFGRKVRQGTVVYIAGEGHRGFGRRREAWGAHHGVDTKSAPVYLSTGPADLLEDVAAVKEAIAALPEPPALIVIDTLARNFGAGDENSTKDMSAFIKAVDHLRADYPDCVVLIVHHSGHTDQHRARGAMALKGAVDIEYRLESTPKGVLLTNTKMKDGEPPKPLHMVLQPVGQSAVLVEGEDQPTDDGAKVSPQQRMALDAYVQAAISLGHPGDDTPVSTEAWRQAVYDALGDKSQDTKKKAFANARKSLAEKGFLIEDGDGYRPDHIRQMAIRTARMVPVKGPVVCV